MHLFKRIVMIAALAVAFALLFSALLAAQLRQQAPADADVERYLNELNNPALWRDTEARRRSFAQVIQTWRPQQLSLRNSQGELLEQYVDKSDLPARVMLLHHVVTVPLADGGGHLVMAMVAPRGWPFSAWWLKLGLIWGVAVALAAFSIWRALSHERVVRQAAEKIIAGERDPSALPHEVDHVVLSAFTRLLHEHRELHDAQVKAMDSVRHRSFVDAETALGNRAYFDAHLEVQLRDRDVNVAGMLILIEIGDINAEADQQRHYVQRIAELIRHHVREFNEPVIARRDRASFSLLLPGMVEREVDVFCKRLLGDVRQLHQQQNGPADTVIAHMGLVTYRSGLDSYKLLSEADMALRVAQQREVGSGWHRFEQGEIQQNSVMGRVRWRALIERVIEQRSIHLFYHAVVLGSDRRVVHYEVLTRIPSDEGDLFSAATFMPMAHRVGLAVAYDRLVCDIVLKSLLFGPQHSPVLTINLSGDAIADNNFRMWLLEHLAQNRLLAERLVFEIGESVATRLSTVEHSFLEMLNRCGSALCVEHVGHPQYSANYLQSGLYRFVKFHRGLTRDIVEDKQAQEFVRGLAALASSTGAYALAECVENDDQWNCLLSLGVRGGQGYLFGKPTNKPVKVGAPVPV